MKLDGILWGIDGNGGTPGLCEGAYRGGEGAAQGVQVPGPEPLGECQYSAVR